MIIKGYSNVLGEHGVNSHGGIGGYFVRILMTDEFESPMKYMRELVLESGSSIGIHPHDGDEEVYFIIDGKGLMIVDNEEREVITGDAVLTKSGSCHGLKNIGEQSLRIFVVCAAIKANL